jgi:hypothetical protein
MQFFQCITTSLSVHEIESVTVAGAGFSHKKSTREIITCFFISTPAYQDIAAGDTVVPG